MFHLAVADQLLHRARYVLDRHVGIDAMLVEEVDDIGPEPLQRSVGDLADVSGPAIQADLLAGFGIDLEAELGGDRDLLAERRKRLADHLFVGERSIDLRGIEEGHAALDRRADQSDALLPVEGGAVTKVDPHASEADRGNFESAFSKLACLHRRLSMS
jgi:hypothetical protein